MSRRRQPSLSTALAVVRALALMRIELALNGLPGLFDGGVRPELSITGFTDADERGPFRHDSPNCVLPCPSFPRSRSPYKSGGYSNCAAARGQRELIQL
jgi:hypothetical protein